MSNLVDHARRELTLIGEDEETTEGLIKVIQAFADMGHSGGSASICIPMINSLLSFEPLLPLTDDPEEWNEIQGDMLFDPNTPLWQSQRNPAAFSNDRGKTYYLVSEKGMDNQPKYISKPRTKK